MMAVACSSRDSTKPEEGVASLAAVAGTVPQTATAGSMVPTPPSVRAVDAQGAAVAGAVVTFTVSAGGGVVVGGTATTDASGIASVTSWTLGPVAGANTLTAQVAGRPAVIFTATGVAGVVAQLSKTSTDPQNGIVGSAVTAAPSVTVRDANGNPVAGVAVTFTVTAGQGTVAGATASSSASGVASVGSWTLGNVTGVNTLTASAVGVQSVAFTATSAAGPVVSVSITSVVTPVMPGATQQLVVSARDAYGNVIAGAPLTYSTGSSTIATVSSAGLVTGVAYGSTTLTVSSGTVSTTVPLLVAGRPAGDSRVNIQESGRPFGVRVSPSGVVYVGEQDNARLGRYDLPSTTLSGTASVGIDPADIAFSPDGATAYVTNLVSGTLSVVNVATNTQTAAITMPGGPLRLVVSADGTRVYVTTINGHLVTVDPQSGIVASLVIGGVLNGIAWHPTQPLLYVSSTGGTVTEVSRATGLVTRSFAIAGTVQEVVVSIDGSQLFVANEGGALEVRSTTTLALQTSVPIASGAFGAAITPDNTQLYVTQSGGSNVLVLDRATMTLVRSYPGGIPRRVVFDKNGTTAVVGNDAGYVTFIR